jgi:hypothetical protein
MGRSNKNDDISSAVLVSMGAMFSCIADYFAEKAIATRIHREAFQNREAALIQQVDAFVKQHGPEIIKEVKNEMKESDNEPADFGSIFGKNSDSK